MTEIIFENIVQIAAILLITLIGALGAWLTAKLGKSAELQNISAATNEVIGAARQTVLELQQTTVDGWKQANADGKLTQAEIAELGKLLLNGAMEKMSDASKNLLNAAGVDISAIITGAGEALVAQLNQGKTTGR